jgi:hypothetical protein
MQTCCEFVEAIRQNACNIVKLDQSNIRTVLIEELHHLGGIYILSPSKAKWDTVPLCRKKPVDQPTLKSVRENSVGTEIWLPHLKRELVGDSQDLVAELVREIGSPYAYPPPSCRIPTDHRPRSFGESLVSRRMREDVDYDRFFLALIHTPIDISNQLTGVDLSSLTVAFGKFISNINAEPFQVNQAP